MIILVIINLLMISCANDSSPTESTDNHPPVFTLPDKFSLAANDTLEINFADYVEDEDGDNLSLSVSGNNEITVLITGLLVEIFAQPDWTGSENVVFAVNDGNISEPVTASVIIEVYDLLGTVISIEDITTTTGSEFYISMHTSMIDLDWQVISYQCTLSFDTDYLSYIDVNQENTICDGMLLGNENEPGSIIIANAGVDAIEGEGSIVNIGFQALQPGETEIEIIEFKYNSTYLNNLENGTVTIK